MSAATLTQPETLWPWFRFYNDVTSNPLIRDLTDFELRVFVAMKCLAARSPGCDRNLGRLTVSPTGEPVNLKTIEVESWSGDIQSVEAAISALRKKGLVALDDDGVYRVAFRWFQYESDSSTKRTQAHRERKRKQDTLAPSLPEQSTSEDSTAQQNTPEQNKGERPQERSLGDVQECGGEYPCPQCEGLGHLDGLRCEWCGGSGVCTP